MTKVGRNDPCPCGSGKKYKKCCSAKESSITDLSWQKMRRTEGALLPVLLEFSAKRYGPNALFEAWEEFNNGADIDIKENEPPLEFETIFMPWFLYNWIPDKFDECQADYPEKPIASLYLDEKSRKLDSFQQRFIKAVGKEHFSFFVVTEVVSGKSLALKDLLLKRTVSVHERQGSENIRTGSIIFARTVTLDNCSIMLGCAPLIIPGTYHPYFIDLRDDWQKAINELGYEFLFEFDYELRDIYHEINDQLYNRGPPQLVNTENDPIRLTKLRYALNCLPQEALDALQTLAGPIRREELLDDGRFNSKGELESIKVPWLEKTGSEKMSGQATLKGDLTISGNELIVDVNSQNRADTIKRKISRRLGKRAVFKHSVIQSTEKLMEDIQSGNSLHTPSRKRLNQKKLQSRPEVQKMLQEMAAQHWRKWLDSPLPALKNKTPRESAKTAKGREQLEGLFLHFAGLSGDKAPEPFEPDIDFLRNELGMNRD